ncbi:MAG: hypothetical protein QM721_13440 [Micropruina sp.]
MRRSLAAQPDGPAGRVGEPDQQVRQRRLAGAARPDQRERLALRDGQVDAVQHRGLPVAGVDPAQFERAAAVERLGGRRGVVDRGWCPGDVVDAAGRRGQFAQPLPHREDAGDWREGVEDQHDGDRHHLCGQLTGPHLAAEHGEHAEVGGGDHAVGQRRFGPGPQVEGAAAALQCLGAAHHPGDLPSHRAQCEQVTQALGALQRLGLQRRELGPDRLALPGLQRRQQPQRHQ